MLGTHNSLTCFPPRHWWMKPFSFIWKCQDAPWKDQLTHVDYFDLRIRFDRKGVVRFCHGLVDLDCYASSVRGKSLGFEYVLLQLESYGRSCRVVLERGDSKENRKRMMDILEPYLGAVVKSVVVKKGWVVLYSAVDEPDIIDYSYIPFYSDVPWWKQLGSLKISTPKRWAERHNILSVTLAKRGKSIHFLDYIRLKNLKLEQEESK